MSGQHRLLGEAVEQHGSQRRCPTNIGIRIEEQRGQMPPQTADIINSGNQRPIDGNCLIKPRRTSGDNRHSHHQRFDSQQAEPFMA